MINPPAAIQYDRRYRLSDMINTPERRHQHVDFTSFTLTAFPSPGPAGQLVLRSWLAFRRATELGQLLPSGMDTCRYARPACRLTGRRVAAQFRSSLGDQIVPLRL